MSDKASDDEHPLGWNTKVIVVRRCAPRTREEVAEAGARPDTLAIRASRLARPRDVVGACLTGSHAMVFVEYQ